MWKTDLQSKQTHKYGEKCFSYFSVEVSSTYPPSFLIEIEIHIKCYLVGALAHGVDQFLDDHVHTLDTGLLQLYDLLLDDGLKRHVWGKKSSPENHQEGGGGKKGGRKLGHFYLAYGYNLRLQ